MVVDDIFEDVTTYIFDVDGTLYSQKKMRLFMIRDLLISGVSRPKQLYIIYMFRKLREKHINDSIEDICAKITICAKESVLKCVNYWMFERPLMYIEKCKYQDVQEFINIKQNNHCKIYIYSDYPAHEKLLHMGIRSEHVFCAEDKEIHGQKPNERAMQYIFSNLQEQEKSKILYIGDRYEKDGLSAKSIGIKYYDIKDFRKIINSCSIKDQRKNIACVGNE